MSYLENVRTFVRVYELGSMSAAGRDLRISPAVTSSRISQLEEHLGIRLFQRTTRNLTPTEQGKAFYRGSVDILEAVENAEAQVANITVNLRGSIFIAAPLGVGRRLIAPRLPTFLDKYPEVNARDPTRAGSDGMPIRTPPRAGPEGPAVHGVHDRKDSRRHWHHRASR